MPGILPVVEMRVLAGPCGCTCSVCQARLGGSAPFHQGLVSPLTVSSCVTWVLERWSGAHRLMSFYKALRLSVRGQVLFPKECFLQGGQLLKWLRSLELLSARDCWVNVALGRALLSSLYLKWSHNNSDIILDKWRSSLQNKVPTWLYILHRIRMCS